MDLKRRDRVSVQYECTDGIFSKHGTFIKQDDESVMIRGEIGEDIGKPIIIPKSRIVMIRVDAPGRE